MLGFGAAGVPGVSKEGFAALAKSVGLRYGEKKESRYRAIKKASFNMQKVKRTYYTWASANGVHASDHEGARGVGAYLVGVVLT